MDYLFGLTDKVRTKDHPFTRLDPVHKCTTATDIQSFKECHSKTFLIIVVVKLMVDTYPTCPGSSVHKLEAYPQEFDLPSLSDHRSVDGKPSCESVASPMKHAATPRSKLRTGDLNKK
jgi:hypothetical protein